jgi:transposase InsO family protein
MEAITPAISASNGCARAGRGLSTVVPDAHRKRMAENFNKTLSYENLFLEEQTETKADIGEWIERIYNERRLHLGICYLPPV